MNYSNNATGTLISLFSIYPGPTETEVSPKEKLEFLVDILLSDSKVKSEISLESFKSAFNDMSYYRIVRDEYIGNKRMPELWQAKTYDEVYQSYRSYWKSLADNVDNLDDEIKEKAIDILLNSFRLIIKYAPESDHFLLDYLRDFLGKHPKIKSKLLGKVK